MVEEEGFDDGLQDADEIVAAADMGELVGKDSFDLVGRQTAETTERDEDDGAQPADDRRDLHQGGVKEPDGTCHFDAAGDSMEDLEQIMGWGLSRGGDHALGADEANAETDEEKNDSRQPDGEHGRHGAVELRGDTVRERLGRSSEAVTDDRNAEGDGDEEGVGAAVFRSDDAGEGDEG